MTRPLSRRATLAAGLGLAAAPLAQAQTPPAPIRIIVPFPPGGSTDLVGRLIAPHVQQGFGVTTVVDNRPGASGSLGAAAVARAQPDGATWLVVFDTHVVNPALIPNLGFDTERDLAPVLLIGTAPMVLCTPRNRPWTTMAEALAAARAKPDTVTYGTIGNGSLAHLTMTLAGKAGGFKVVHVPYRGGGPLQNAAVAGETDLVIATATVLNAHIESGALKLLAQTGSERSPRMPNTPTLAELGMPGLDARAFWGVLAPGQTPAPLIARMEAALRAGLETPALRERLEALHIDVAPQGPEAFRAFQREQIAIWGRVVRENDIRAD